MNIIRLDPRENRPISRIFSHRIQIAQHRLGPCRVVKITNDAVPSIGDVFKCIISAIASKEMGTVHLLTPVPQGSVSTDQLPSCVIEGKKTHVMVLWCATNPGEVFAGYFHTCTAMIKRWKGSWVAVLGFHTDDPALAWCSVKELMSVRDVWGAHKSRRPAFGPSRGPEGRPTVGQPSQSNGRVKNGLLDLCRTQT